VDNIKVICKANRMGDWIRFTCFSRTSLQIIFLEQVMLHGILLLFIADYSRHSFQLAILTTIPSFLNRCIKLTS